MNGERSFINYFKQKITYLDYHDESVIEIIIKLNIERRRHKYICLVEGIQDIVFYGNLGIDELGTDIEFLYATGNENTQKLIAKQNVLNSYLFIKNHETLNEKMNKYIFIVDQDYDGIDYYKPDRYSQYRNFSKTDRKNISTTQGYSFENYFMTDDNVEKIFEIVSQMKGFNKNKEWLTFNKKYKEFIKEICEFFSWFACITYGIRQNYFYPYPRLTKAEEIFKYDFSSKDVYNKELLEQGTKERKEIVYKNTYKLKREQINDLKKIQEKYYERIKSEEYIQGHTLYNYLNEYFKYNFNFDLGIYSQNKPFVNMILNQLKFDFCIKLGNGKVIKGEKEKLTGNKLKVAI